MKTKSKTFDNLCKINEGVIAGSKTCNFCMWSDYTKNGEFLICTEDKFVESHTIDNDIF